MPTSFAKPNNALLAAIILLFALVGATGQPRADAVCMSGEDRGLHAVETLLSPPNASQPALTPDGQFAVWISRRNGPARIVVAPVAAPERRRDLAFNDGNLIDIRLLSDSRRAATLSWSGGKFRIGLIDLYAGQRTPVTESTSPAGRLLAASDRMAGRIAWDYRTPDGRFVIEILDLDQRRLIAELAVGDYEAVTLAPDLTPAFAWKADPDGGLAFDRWDETAKAWQLDHRVDFPHIYGEAPIAAGTEASLWLDGAAGPYSRLVVRTPSGISTTLTDGGAEPTMVFVRHGETRPEALAIAAGFPAQGWQILDDRIADDLSAIRASLGDGILPLPLPRAVTGQAILIQQQIDAGPNLFWLYRREGRNLTRLDISADWLCRAARPRLDSFTFRARDGLDVPAYLTLPAAAHPPLAVVVHGGPWGTRDTTAYDPFVQGLTERGLAVLQVNFRGSPGFGGAFGRAGLGQWGGRMLDDIEDGIAAVAARGDVDTGHPIIAGASYGGYAALRLGQRRADTACVIAGHAPTDLVALMSYPPDQPAAHARYRQLIGEAPDRIAAQSPDHHLAQQHSPLLLIARRGDRVVPFASAEAFAHAVEKAGRPIRFVAFDHGDHAGSDFTDMAVELGLSLAFVDACLGRTNHATAKALLAGSARMVIDRLP